MSEVPELPPLPNYVRDQLPPEAQAYIWTLEQQVVSLRAEVASLQAQVASQQEQIERLQAQVNQNTDMSGGGNSAIAPSLAVYAETFRINTCPASFDTA